MKNFEKPQQWMILLICMFFPPVWVNARADLEVFDFATTEAARASWKPGSGSPRVELFEGIPGKEKRGIRLPFGDLSLLTGNKSKTLSSRSYWDREVSFDLSGEQNISLRIYIEEPRLISYFTIYFHSPGGWYAYSWSGLEQGWQTLKAGKADARIESSPSGWDQIDLIRISPWFDQTSFLSEIIATELTAFTTPISIVKGTKNPDTQTVKNTTELLASGLDAYSVDYNLVTDEDVEQGALEGSKLAFFPYNRNLTGAEYTAIEDFVTSGGKIVAFYTSEKRIIDLLDIHVKGWKKISLGAMRFLPGLVDCIPERMSQASWNIYETEPASTSSHVLALWEDAEGRPLEDPAWIVSENGAYMSHILLSDDLYKKQRLILSLAAHFVPEVGQQAMQAAFESIGKIGPYSDFSKAAGEIREEGIQTPRSARILDFITSATLVRTRAEQALSSGVLCPVLELSEKSREYLREAYYLCQHPETPEFRSVWNHSGTGAWKGDWERSALNLLQNGFNAILPNMLWGGLAHYNSAILPLSDTYKTYGDQVEACVEACHKYGIEVHVWKVNWNLSNAPQEFIDLMRSENRTQLNAWGEPVDWLCPSHPDNRKLESDAMLEVALNYNVDGIHFDYIRYPDSSCCYCDGCRARFESDTGISVGNWPDDCYSGIHKDAYRDWRAKQITLLVKDVSQRVETSCPDVKVSAAVFSSYPGCRDSVGQDWAFWVKEGYLDFLCPMDYTNSSSTFQSRLESQLELVNGAVPVYPGVGVTASSSSLSPDQAIAQLRIARDHGTKGFVLFNYSNLLAETHLPALRKGFTAPERIPQMFLLK